MKAFTILASLVATALLGRATDANPVFKRACSAYHTVSSSDAPSFCSSIASKAGISLATLYSLNPQVNNSSCGNLELGEQLCIASGGASVPTSIPTSTPTKIGGSALDTSCVSYVYGACKSYHTIVVSDTCQNLISAYAMTMDSLIKLNPSVKVNCAITPPMPVGYRMCHAARSTTTITNTATALCIITLPTKTTSTTSTTSITSITSVPTSTGDIAATIKNATDFCFFLPPSPGGDIAGHEDDAIAFCTAEFPETPEAKIFPSGFIKLAYYKEGKKAGKYVQVTGQINIEKYNLSPKDQGGQYDSEGSPRNAYCSGYPHFVNLVEPNDKRFCIRCCSIRSDCNFGHSKLGCPYVVPGKYGSGGMANPINHPNTVFNKTG